MSEEDIINYLKDITENKNFKICFLSDDMAKTVLNLIERLEKENEDLRESY